MKAELWTALRHADLNRAKSAMVAELKIRPSEELDETTILAAVHVEQLTRVPLGLPWRDWPRRGDAQQLFELTSALGDGTWSGVLLMARESLRGGGMTALAASVMADVALSVGDVPLARSVVLRALERFGPEPVVAFAAFRTEREQPFLAAPDVLLADMDAAVRSLGTDYYLQPLWPSVTAALGAWMNHRDGETNEAQKDLRELAALCGNRPLDVQYVVPFLHDMQATLGAEYVKAYVSPRLFPLVHVKWGELEDRTAKALLAEAERHAQSSPEFLLMAAQRGALSVPVGQIAADMPWHLKLARLAAETALENDEEAAALEHVLRAMVHAYSAIDEYNVLAGRLETKRGAEAVVAAMVDFASQGPGWKDVSFPDEHVRALARIRAAGAWQSLVRLLNSTAETRSVSEMAMMLTQRESRPIIESFQAIEALSGAALCAWGVASLSMGLKEITMKVLTHLERSELRADQRLYASQIAQLLELRHTYEASDREHPDSVARALAVSAMAGVGDFLYIAEERAEYMRSRGHISQISGLIAFALQTMAHPEVVHWAASKLHELKDSDGALDLLDRHREVWESSSPACWRVRCKILQALGRYDEWRVTADAARAKFPSEVAFRIESGMQLAMSGAPREGLKLLVEALSEEPTDTRGLEVAELLAQQFDLAAWADLLEVVVGAQPDEVVYRDKLIAVLSRFEGKERALLQHLYYRVYIRPQADEEKRAAYRRQLATIRRLLTPTMVDASTSLRSFVDLHRTILDSWLQEIANVCGFRLAGVVATEVIVTSQEEGKQEQRASVPGIAVALDTRGLMSGSDNDEGSNLSETVRASLTRRGFKPPVVILTVDELWNSLRRADDAPLSQLLRGLVLHDTSFLNALRLLDRHCRLLTDKFEDYLLCYVVSGSFVRGRLGSMSDIDVWAVFDDSDVRSMNPLELQDRLVQITRDFAANARAEFGVRRELHPQSYQLSRYWQFLQRASPVVVSLLRDGVPLLDRGVFRAWSHLLRAGHLRVTREALEERFKGIELLETEASEALRKAADALANPIKYGVIHPLEIMLEVLGIEVGDYREVMERARAELFEGRRLILEEDLTLATEAVEYWKSREAGVRLSVEDALRLYRRVQSFSERSRQAYQQMMHDRDRLQLAGIVARIDDVLEKTTVVGAPEWRARLEVFRSEVRALDDPETDNSLKPLKVAALIDRISDIAPWIANI